ncbi:MAG: hypothetical protein R3F59_25515 [Myxococcota bacterium]
MDPLELGRQRYAARAWDAAWRALSEADAAGPLGLDDLERLAWACGLTARESAFLEALERLHAARLAAGDELGAARTAFWLGMRLIGLGEAPRASGWFQRCARLVGERDCVERGYLGIPAVAGALAAGDLDAARAAAERAAQTGLQFGDPDLVAFARCLHGRVLLRQGEVQPGLRLLDETMISVGADELSPMVTGLVYCTVIAACQAVYAHDRSRAWTDALAAWCDAQPELVPFRGVCRVHRCELLALCGRWDGALDELTTASQELSRASDPAALAAAHYQRGEIHRLRGGLAVAEVAYAAAHREGRDPQPGLALLRLAQGRTDTALASLRRVLEGARARRACPASRPGSRSCWPRARSTRPTTPAPSSRPPRSASAPPWSPPRPTPGAAPCCWRAAPPETRWRRSAAGSPAGSGSAPRTRRRGCACCWPVPASPSTTRTARRWSARRPARR